MKILIICLLSAQAFCAPEFFEKLVDKVRNYLSPALVEKVEENAIGMPAFPVIKKDPKDASKIDRISSELDHPFYKRLNQEQLKGLQSEFLIELYGTLLSRSLYQEEIESSMNILMQGASREGIYRSIVLGSAYRDLEKETQQPSKASLDFVVTFMKDFLAREASRSILSKTNFYTLKKVVVEVVLELFDSYPSDKDRLAWFSIFSETYGKSTGVFAEKHRQYSTRDEFNQWGSKLPMDIVKSEVILKIHKLLNSKQF